MKILIALLKNHLFGKPRAIFLCFFFLFGVGNTIFAQKNLRLIDPSKKLTQYILDHWTTENGLPSNNVRRLFQTKDGFLWLAGFDGLVSFDGVRFMSYNKRNTENLFNSSIYALDESKDGTLWVGTEGSGLFALKNGKLQKVGLDKFFISSIFIENDQRFWISGRNEGVFTYNPQSKILQTIDYPQLSKVSVYSIKKDKKGNIWFGSDGKGLTYLQNNRFVTFTEKDSLPSNNIIEIFFDKQQTLWVGTTEGLAYLKGNKFVAIPELKGNIIYRVLQDESGSLWIASSKGLYRRNTKTKAFELYPSQKESPVTNVSDIFLDPEGSLWIGTYRNGLFRLKDGKFNNHTYQDGLATASVGSICELDSGKYLLGMNNGKINLINKNKISLFPTKNQLPDVRVFNILKDKDKNLWLSTFNGLVKVFPDGREFVFKKENGLPDNTVRITYEDKKGNIWIGTRWGGLAKYDSDKKFTLFNTKNGLSSNFIMSIREDLEGNIWVGTNDAGLNIISMDGKIKQFDNQKGLASNTVFNTYTDKEGITWIVSNGGISRYEKGKFTNFTPKEGLINDSPFDFVEDDLGHIWLPTTRGVIQVSKKQLNDFAKGKIKNINWIDYDRHDGMKSEDCTGAAHSLKATDGKIWIPTNGGALVIDPRNIPRNHLKPAIRINTLLVDNEPIDIHKKLEIAPNKVRLVFDYSALSLLASSKVRFKYQLVGFDKDWIDAKTERQAIYTNLPPGNFTFRVIACNNDGVWNEEGISLQITKKPFFYQTLWFYVWLFLLVMFGIATIFRWRVYAIQQRKRELEVLVELKTSEVKQQNVELAQQRDEITYQKKLVDKRNENITNSINYAKRIQEAILPQMDEIKSILPESFVFFEPKDIVSGDFYWISQVKFQEVGVPIINLDGETLQIDRIELMENTYQKSHLANLPPAMMAYTTKTFVAAVDCTGHGVPGAFMSMIGNDQLNEIINLRRITQPDKILQELNKNIHKTLKQYENANRDGMDMVICTIDHDNRLLEFAGAKNPLFYIQDNELFEIKGDKIPIGGFYKGENNNKPFTKHTISLNKPTWVYLFSDGYQDQFGEHSRKKFSRKRIRELLLEIHQEDMATQKKLMKNTIFDWIGTEEQIDDILVMGFKVGEI